MHSLIETYIDPKTDIYYLIISNQIVLLKKSNSYTTIISVVSRNVCKFCVPWIIGYFALNEKIETDTGRVVIEQVIELSS